MSTARPPSQPPRDTAMDAARGTVRDALGSLGNLALLSGSAKVGSKAIAGVLPDVLAACGPTREALLTLIEGLRRQLPSSRVPDEIEEFVLPRLDELEEELQGRVNEPLRTPERLGLDRVLGRLSRELDAVQSLLELLEVAGYESPFPFKVNELLRQRLPASPSGRRPARRFTARLSVTDPLPEVLLKPRAFSTLVAAAAELLSDPDGSPGISIAVRNGAVEIYISTAAATGAELVVWGYGVIAPSHAAIRAAAELTEVEISEGEGGILLALRAG
ncbi:MAG TPA: hypothetical protein VMI54_29100 [Polyangiaceae bacterium]|nr:hypothetical protein [Polyangiaceae bacterium]